MSDEIVRRVEIKEKQEILSRLPPGIAALARLADASACYEAELRVRDGSAGWKRDAEIRLAKAWRELGALWPDKGGGV